MSDNFTQPWINLCELNIEGPRLHSKPLDLLGQRALAPEPPGGAQLEVARGQPAAGQDDAAGAHAGQEAHRHEPDEAGSPQEGA